MPNCDASENILTPKSLKFENVLEYVTCILIIRHFKNGSTGSILNMLFLLSSDFCFQTICIIQTLIGKIWKSQIQLNTMCFYTNE